MHKIITKAAKASDDKLSAQQKDINDLMRQEEETRGESLDIFAKR